MGDKSKYLRNSIINTVLLGQTFTGSGSIWVGLHTAAPLDGNGDKNSNSGNGTEINNANYSRQRIYFTTSSSGTSQNSNEISFGIASATFQTTGSSATTITHYAIHDQEGIYSGNILYADSLNTSQTVLAGNEARFAIGTLTLTEV